MEDRMKTMRILLAMVFAMSLGLQVKADVKEEKVVFDAVIDCAGCKAKLEKELPYVKGVKSFKVDMATSTVEITYKKDKTSPEALKTAIEKVSDVKIKGVKGAACGCAGAKKGEGCCGGEKKAGEGCCGGCGGGEKKAEGGCCGGEKK